MAINHLGATITMKGDVTVMYTVFALTHYLVRRLTQVHGGPHVPRRIHRGTGTLTHCTGIHHGPAVVGLDNVPGHIVVVHCHVQHFVAGVEPPRQVGAGLPRPTSLVPHFMSREPAEPSVVALLQHSIVQRVQVHFQLVAPVGAQAWRGGRSRRGDGIPTETLRIPQLYSEDVVVGGYVGARVREREYRECETERARGPVHVWQRPRAN